ncbi:hypothetical protein TNCV_4373951 [Trichonephila clavipes]|uniref:Uncharacterized protein n=1 Tax=Trichonephila clavipes TaxID=2585209 RepID=A0A8X6RCM2_TRICX|nr:hypothetical protein TNCV_4373951 [Trichonephila clavipes]
MNPSAAVQKLCNTLPNATLFHVDAWAVGSLVVRASDSRPEGLGSLPDASEYTRSTLHAEIVEVEIEVVSPSIVRSGNFAELNRTVTCMVLKANDRRTSCPCHDEFRGPRSDYVRQVASENNNNNVDAFAFSQRSSSPRLTEDETLNDSDIIKNLINYEDGQEARFFESG